MKSQIGLVTLYYGIKKGNSCVSLYKVVFGLVLSTVTNFFLSTQTPFIAFTYHLKLYKKGDVIKGEYNDLDIDLNKVY